MAKRRKTRTRKGRGKNYKHPIPGRNELLEHLKDAGQPLRSEAILSAFGLKGLRHEAALLDTLQKMVRAGQVIENRRGEFCLVAKLDLLTGTVSGHNDGFGFVRRLVRVERVGARGCHRTAPRVRPIRNSGRSMSRESSVESRESAPDSAVLALLASSGLWTLDCGLSSQSGALR